MFAPRRPMTATNIFPTWSVDVIDENGVTVARVRKTLYIRKGADCASASAT